MSLNIKNERVHQLARQAAAATGKTQTGAIEAALELLLVTVGKDPAETERRGRIDIVMSLRGSVSMAALPGHIAAHEELYDAETGLPA